MRTPAPGVTGARARVTAARTRGTSTATRRVRDLTAGIFKGSPPPESNYILSGITREVTIELCRQEGIECVEVGVLDTDLAHFDEAFVTGTSDDMTPVVRSTPMSWRPEARPDHAAAGGGVPASTRG